MKATDLMIGDWVLVKPSMLPIKVEAVHKKKVGYHAVTHKLNWVRIGLFEPIPLTLEILQKNGFKTDGEAIWASFCPEDNEFALEISEPNYYDENYGERGYWWTINACEYSIIPLRYVHELQHALKLCGIEKEIAL